MDVESHQSAIFHGDGPTLIESIERQLLLLTAAASSNISSQPIISAVSNGSVDYEQWWKQQQQTTTTTSMASTMRTMRDVILALYSSIFLFGIVANLMVIAMIINVLSSISGRERRYAPSSFSTISHVLIYVLALSIVDLLVIAHLPILISEIYFGQWIFGSVMCKAYLMGECVNKTLSTFLLTVLSFDRFVAVTFPISSIRFRSVKMAVFVVGVCVTVALVLMTPILIGAHVDNGDGSYSNDYNDIEKHSPNITNISFDAVDEAVGRAKPKCMFDHKPLFTWLQFALGYALPALLMLLFYSRVLTSLQQSTNSVKRYNPMLAVQSSIRLKRVTMRILAVVLFYFVSWTPQWLFTICNEIGLPLFEDFHIQAILFYFAHILVCVNSAGNPILYALLNRELRLQNSIAMERRRQSISTAVTKATQDFVAKHNSTIQLYSNRDGTLRDIDRVGLLTVSPPRKAPSESQLNTIHEYTSRGYQQGARPALNGHLNGYRAVPSEQQHSAFYTASMTARNGSLDSTSPKYCKYVTTRRKGSYPKVNDITMTLLNSNDHSASDNNCNALTNGTVIWL